MIFEIRKHATCFILLTIYHYSLCTMSNLSKYLPKLILVVRKALHRADINKVLLKYCL